MRNAISLDINVDEGKLFVVSRVEIVGLDESGFQNLLKEITLKPGDVYNQRLVELFLEREAPLLSVDGSVQPRFNLHLNERQGRSR